MGFIQILIHYVIEILPALIVGFIISGVVHEFVPAKWVERHLGTGGILPIVWATVVGTILPVCCWGSLPIAVSFYKKGSRLGPVLAFLVATPATSVTALFVAYRLMGFGFTLYIFLSVIAMGLVIGLAGNAFRYKPKEFKKGTCPHCKEDVEKCVHKIKLWGRVKGIVKFAFVDMPREIGFELLLGLLLAAVVASFVPLGKLINNYLSGFIAYPFSLVFGLVMYFCSTASVPLVHALIGQGMNIGAALVLLLVGPITSYGTILVLRKEFGVKILVYYLLSICFLATGLGYLFFLIMR